jgi:hypothetical protein
LPDITTFAKDGKKRIKHNYRKHNLHKAIVRQINKKKKKKEKLPLQVRK